MIVVYEAAIGQFWPLPSSSCLFTYLLLGTHIPEFSILGAHHTD